MMSTAHALDYKMEARGKSGAAGRGGMWRREIYGKRKLERGAGGGFVGVEGWGGEYAVEEGLSVTVLHSPRQEPGDGLGSSPSPAAPPELQQALYGSTTAT